MHIAIVLGEGDKFIGIVTLEDLLEEFVGEIQDEQDIGRDSPRDPQQPTGSFEAEAA